MQEVKINVAMMAGCRERRREKQISAIEAFGVPCISFSLNIPGSIKDKPVYRVLHQKGMVLLDNSFGNFIKFKDLTYLPTGPEAIIAVSLDAGVIKKQTIKLEDSTPMGRLFDMDVIDVNGTSLSRRDLGMPGRKCLICENEAALCARSRKHSLDQLLERIRLIADQL